MELQEHIVDSGARLKFSTGAVRDIQKGKGRCDLLPLSVIADLLQDKVLWDIDSFRRTGDINALYNALNSYAGKAFTVEDDYVSIANMSNMILEVSKHFEAGAEKYGEYNWQKGLPIHCYINSAVRHYFKYLRGDDDERHDRAFVWNILCCIWTYINKPELDDFCEKGE